MTGDWRSRSGFENWLGNGVLFSDNSASLYLEVKMGRSKLLGKPKEKSIRTDYGLAFNHGGVGIYPTSSDGNRDRL